MPWERRDIGPNLYMWVRQSSFGAYPWECDISKITMFPTPWKPELLAGCYFNVWSKHFSWDVAHRQACGQCFLVCIDTGLVKFLDLFVCFEGKGCRRPRNSVYIYCSILHALRLSMQRQQSLERLFSECLVHQLSGFCRLQSNQGWVPESMTEKDLVAPENNI